MALRKAINSLGIYLTGSKQRTKVHWLNSRFLFPILLIPVICGVGKLRRRFRKRQERLAILSIKGGEMAMKIEFVLIGLMVSLAGCASSMNDNRQQVARSSLTPGMAKKAICEGSTTQAEIVKCFGSPNLIMRRSNGQGEVWTYDQVSVVKESNGYSVGSMLLGGAASPATTASGGATGFSVSGHTNTSAVRTITVLIEFDPNEVVQKYELMATAF